MPGLLFLQVVDWVLWSTVEHAGTGIRWKVTTTLEDLDLAIILSTFTHILTKIDRLNRHGKETGLKLNTNKTKLMRTTNTRNINEAAINGQEIENVDGFDYPGANVRV